MTSASVFPLGSIQKAQELGATVLTCSDSSGYIYDPEGIDLELVKDIKEVRRGRIKEYLEQHPNATYVEGSVWSLKESYDIALPCATQNEIDAKLAQKMADAGVKIVAEGANMPSSKEAIDLYQDRSIAVALNFSSFVLIATAKQAPDSEML